MYTEAKTIFNLEVYVAQCITGLVTQTKIKCNEVPNYELIWVSSLYYCFSDFNGSKVIENKMS